MNKLASILLGLLLVATAAGAVWYYRTYPVDLTRIGIGVPCAKPIPYKVGSIDPRFNLTKEEIATQLGKAAAIWNAAGGKALLTYAPEDPNAMPVNFVYDARQQSVTVGQKIDSAEASQEAERVGIQQMQNAYVAAQQKYAADIEEYNTASQKYSDEVKQVNASGGADAQTYARLQKEQADLKAEQQALRDRGAALKEQGQQLQSRISAFNSNVRQINQVVQQFNSAVGGEFEEGLFVREADGSRHIDIYAYKTTNELLHSLTHEFGHAIGLAHNENPASIMFPYNKSGVTLSDDDIAALKQTCKLQ